MSWWPPGATAGRAAEPKREGGLSAFVVAEELADGEALADYIADKEARGFETTTVVYGRDARSVDGIRSALKDLLVRCLQHPQRYYVNCFVALGCQPRSGFRSKRSVD